MLNVKKNFHGQSFGILTKPMFAATHQEESCSMQWLPHWFDPRAKDLNFPFEVKSDRFRFDTCATLGKS